MGTVVSYPATNRNIATAASLALQTADNPPPKTSIGAIRIEDFISAAEYEDRKLAKRKAAATAGDEPKQKSNHRDGIAEVSWGTEHIFMYNDTVAAWTKLEQHADSESPVCEPYIGRDGKTPCTRKIKKTTIVAKKESDRKLVDAWLRAKTPRPSTAQSDAVPSWDETTDLNHDNVDEDGTAICYQCGEGFLRLIRCRVCGKSIHTPKCVYNETNGDLIVTATSLRCFMTDFVWSCPDCENLLGLLTDEEMIELMESFDDLDVDCDSRISLDDFLKYKHKIFKDKYKRAMDLPEVEAAIEEFRRLDKPNTGEVDWWSFVDSRIVEKLSDRSKSELVSCLTPHEVSEAKMFFRSFDADSDGKITLREAEKAYERWFASLWSKVLNCSDSTTGPKKNPELTKRVGEHVKVNVKIFMEADVKKHGTVSWSQFLRDQSIYILAARRNAANLYKIKPKPDEMEIIEAETTYSRIM